MTNEQLNELQNIRNAVDDLYRKLDIQLYEKTNANIIICLDGDAWEDAKKLYRKLEGGRLTGKVKLIKLPKDKDVGELGGIKGLKQITLL